MTFVIFFIFTPDFCLDDELTVRGFFFVGQRSTISLGRSFYFVASVRIIFRREVVLCVKAEVLSVGANCVRPNISTYQLTGNGRTQFAPTEDFNTYFCKKIKASANRAGIYFDRTYTFLCLHCEFVPYVTNSERWVKPIFQQSKSSCQG